MVKNGEKILMKKKLLVGLGVGAAVALCLGLVGCGKERLATPQNVTVAQRICRWEAVDGAESYTVTVNGEEFTTQECSYSLYTFTEGGEYTVTVSAAAEGYSPSVGASVTVELEEAVRHGFDISGYEYWLLDDCSGYEVACGRVNFEMPSLIIPDYFGEYPVTRIADGAFCRFESSGTYVGVRLNILGEEAYERVYAQQIQLPMHLKSIGKKAFYACAQLEEIIIPDEVEEIGDKAFFYQNGSYGGVSSKMLTIKRLTLPNSLKRIGRNAFCDHELSELILPEGLEEIGGEAFYTRKDSRIVEITIPSSVKALGGNAFKGLKYLTAFNVDASNLEQVAINSFPEDWYEAQPSGLVYFNEDFYVYKAGTEVIENFEVPKGIFAIDTNETFLLGIKSLYIPDGTARSVIDSLMAYSLENAEYIRFPSDMTGKLKFWSSYNLKTFNVPKGIDELSSVKPDNAIEKIYLECSLQHWQELLLGLELPDRSWYTGAAVYEYSSAEPTKSGNYWHYVNGEIVEW